MEIFPTSPYERYGILLGAVIGLVLFFNETTILRYLSLVSLTIGLFSSLNLSLFVAAQKKRRVWPENVEIRLIKVFLVAQPDDLPG